MSDEIKVTNSGNASVDSEEALKETSLDLSDLANEAIERGGLDKATLLQLVDAPFEDVCAAANDIRKRCCGDAFELCSIMNVKSGKCSENCKFCAQSASWNTEVECYPFVDSQEIVAQAQADAHAGSHRFSYVASGQRISKADIDRACSATKEILAETKVQVCASFGLLDKVDFERLHAAGVSRVHNNLETSRSYFSKICTTHDYDRKIQALRDARAAGMELCSGGIIGMGETWEDRIDLAYELRKLKVNSVPLNVLNPIPGTPLDQLEPLSLEEVCRTFAIFRFALPFTTLRLAGGRALLPEAGRACLHAGANAAISGDMLTTAGFDIPSDVRMVSAEGFSPSLIQGN